MFYFLLVLFAAVITGVDQLTKYLAAATLSGRTVTLIPGWLELHYITNDGMALSMFRGGRWFFVVITILFFGLLIFAVAKKFITKRFELWCAAAVAGGALGNLIDRISCGKVIDMICVPWFSTFNVADIFITLGAALFVLYVLIRDKEFLEDKPKKEENHDTDA